MDISYLAQEHVIGLILDRHEHNENAIEELQPLQGAESHVEEHPEQNGHRNVGEQRSQQNRTANHEENQNVGDTLLPDTQELGLLARGCCLGLQLQTVDVTDAQDSGSHEPEE